MKLCWLDVRFLDDGAKVALIEEAAHQRIDGVVSDDPLDLQSLPPTVQKVLLLKGRPLPDDLPTDAVDIVVIDPDDEPAASADLLCRYPEIEIAHFIEVLDAPTLEAACRAARLVPWTILAFRDPTKIPLEIVLAAGESAAGRLITVVADVEEAEIVYGVLERGSEGVMMAAKAVGDATNLKRAASEGSAPLNLVELRVTGIAHVGMGERACVDTCSYLGQDEGILVGSHSKGMMLCVSETHPLPYMPTRPFRVNAGAIHSYTLSTDGRTNYLSDLRSGSRVLAVDVKGQTRVVTVGRVKIESRPMLQIDAAAPDGTLVNLILQDDWHVRLLGPGGTVLNSTELQPGDKLLGHLLVEDRHVGYPIKEFCREQ